MRVRANRQCDARVGGQTKALFPDQFYDLPEDAVAGLISSGHVVEIRAESSLPSVPKARGRARAKAGENAE